VINLFNGKLVLSKKHTQFVDWVNCYNEKFGNNIVVLPQASFVGFNSAWFLGFAEAEASDFSLGKIRDLRFMVKKDGGYYKLKFNWALLSFMSLAT